MAYHLSKKFNVIGFDINKKRVQKLKSGYDLNNELNKRQLSFLLKNSLITSFEKDLSNCKMFIVTVPTPINENFKPDLQNLKTACETISSVLTKNSIIIFESTVYPGLTENFCRKIIERKSGLKFMRDFSLGYSPERVNPGDKTKTIDKITKIISASDKSSLKKIKSIYSSFLNKNIVIANSIQEAEAAKVIENAQRDINIAFINELKRIFDKNKINIYEILRLSKTKWNFIDFEPGLVGGHCIGVDPYYLYLMQSKGRLNHY